MTWKSHPRRACSFFLEAKVDETWNGNDLFWECDRQSFKHNADKKGITSIISGFWCLRSCVFVLQFVAPARHSSLCSVKSKYYIYIHTKFVCTYEALKDKKLGFVLLVFWRYFLFVYVPVDWVIGGGCCSSLVAIWCHVVPQSSILVLACDASFVLRLFGHW